MKRKVFFQQSGLYWFFESIIILTFSWCIVGVIYCSISVFMENEKSPINYIAIFGGILGFLLFGFELLRTVRQVIILRDKEIYVPEEWGMSDGKFQHEVCCPYNEIDHMYFRETTYDSNNKPVPRDRMTLSQLYLVLCCKNGKEKSINILFYTKKVRIRIIDEIINRAKQCGNNFTDQTGEEIYKSYLTAKKR
ncbi:MAG: hypothetical protein J6N93_06650 [Clostridia bacterium]|nr:hypothetical protein [Clostridia bacterium]